MNGDDKEYGKRLEQLKQKRLREITDPVCEDIIRQELPLEAIERRIDKARLEAAVAAPDQLELFDLIYLSRFERLLEQFPPPEDN